MPVTERHPYQDLPYIGDLGTDPGFLQGGFGVLKPTTRKANQLIQQLHPNLVKWTEKVPDITVDYPVKRLRLPWLKTNLMGLYDSAKRTVSVSPYSELDDVETLTHELLHVLEHRKPNSELIPKKFLGPIVERLSARGYPTRDVEENLGHKVLDQLSRAITNASSTPATQRKLKSLYNQLRIWGF